MGLLLLAGPKHAGKSSTGEALAHLLQRPFIDLDERIREEEGMSPRELYRQGREVFYRAETASLRGLLAEASGDGPLNLERIRGICALGGGICDNNEAWELLRKWEDWTVVLEISAQEAWERISREPALPPFLEGEDPQAIHRALHERRSRRYGELKGLHLMVEGLESQEIARRIADSFGVSPGPAS